MRDRIRVPTQTGLHCSDRQREILTLLYQGDSDKVIAARLQISERTVRWHLARLRAVAGAGNRAHLVALAVRDELAREYK